MPVVVIVFVWIVVLPLTLKTLTPVTVSVVPSPKTALPVMVSEFVPPANVPFVVMVEPVRVTLVPSVKLPV